MLEIKSTDEETRGLLAECCSAMNAEYVRMKKIKRLDKVRLMDQEDQHRASVYMRGQRRPHTIDISMPRSH